MEFEKVEVYAETLEKSIEETNHVLANQELSEDMAGWYRGYRDAFELILKMNGK